MFERRHHSHRKELCATRCHLVDKLSVGWRDGDPLDPEVDSKGLYRVGRVQPVRILRHHEQPLDALILYGLEVRHDFAGCVRGAVVGCDDGAQAEVVRVLLSRLHCGDGDSLVNVVASLYRMATRASGMLDSCFAALGNMAVT